MISRRCCCSVCQKIWKPKRLKRNWVKLNCSVVIRRYLIRKLICNGTKVCYYYLLSPWNSWYLSYFFILDILLRLIDSTHLSDDDRVFTMRGDWIQQGAFKEVPVTMKMLKHDDHFQDFMKLAQTWSLIQSPQFIKLYGLTISVPYTMVMEYSKYGPLNKFLQANRDISMYCLLDMMHGLVRGMHYLEDNKIIHSYIRCGNLLVTKYDPEKYVLDAKISDPGYPRPYKMSE